jgi:hypothetical protein
LSLVTDATNYCGRGFNGVILSVLAKDLADASKAYSSQSLIGNGRAFRAWAGCFMRTFSMTPFAPFRLAQKLWAARVEQQVTSDQ